MIVESIHPPAARLTLAGPAKGNLAAGGCIDSTIIH